MPLTEAVKGGDLRASLEALRDELADEIVHNRGVDGDKGGTNGAAVATLSARLLEVLTKLDGMKTPEVSKADDLAKRRADRRAKTSKPAAGAK